jgi:hypothetical protein
VTGRVWFDQFHEAIPWSGPRPLDQ